MKKILVPCDFSATAVQAYAFACDIARQANGEVSVIHAFELPMAYESAFGVQPYIFDAELLVSLESKAKENFDKMRSKLGAKLGRQHFETVFGNITGSILRYIDDHDIDLVVMGTNGASGMQEMFIGSNTEKIVRFSPVPVLSIREGAEISAVRNIVLASSLELNQRQFMEKVKEVQSFFKAKLHVLYINSVSRYVPEKEAELLLEDFAKHYKLENYTTNVRSNFFEQEGIIRFAEQTQADLVMMATHGRRGLSHLFAGSLTEDVVNHIKCPIWTYTLVS